MSEIEKFRKQKKFWSKKRKNIAIVVVALIIIGVVAYGFLAPRPKTIKVSGAFSLYPMMTVWAEEYHKLHPDIKIEVSAGGAGKGMTDALSGIVDIGMVSRGIRQSEIDKGAFYVCVVEDAVLPIVNADNPVISKILTNGVNQTQFKDIFITRTIRTWGQLVGDPSNNDIIRVYTRSDSCGAGETWAKYLGDYNEDNIKNAPADAAVDGDANMAGAIKDDRFGIGYSNVNFVYDANTKKPVSGIKPVPIDFDNNGTIDIDENFYNTRDEIVNAEISNAYLSPPSRYVYLVTKTNFTGITRDFVEWILTDGQKYVLSGGYAPLTEDMIAEQIKHLG